ncbi:MAG: nucleotidyltransferase family protein [Saprospiraceae bacterium]|nr:nucleotidyltransferase family protein [Saprospiraceae bacterium]
MENQSRFNTAVIVLAAGQSERLGTPKQLLPVNGETLLSRICRIALNFNGSGVLVVLGAYASEVKEALVHLPVESVVNPDWKKGMGSSLSLGITQAILRWPEVDILTILLCDQPLVDSCILNLLLQKHLEGKKPLIASDYGHTIGPPVLVHKSKFSLFTKFEGKEGAKKILLENRSDLDLISFPEGIIDIDTPEDWQQYQASV